jgi:hypothetical protein
MRSAQSKVLGAPGYLWCWKVIFLFSFCFSLAWSFHQLGARTCKIDPIFLHEDVATSHQRWHLDDASLRVWKRDSRVQIMDS